MQERTDTPASALWAAAYQGDEAGVRRLLAEGLDVNVWDRHGRSALTFAIKGGHLSIVRRLLEAGAWADPFEEGDIFKSPLMCAAEEGHLEIVETLLSLGADPTKHGGIGVCTAEFYARARHPYVAAILLRAEDKWRQARK
ncbi:MAG: ankyrin repeat domain-containing protein [Nibricoccus sp.]